MHTIFWLIGLLLIIPEPLSNNLGNGVDAVYACLLFQGRRYFIKFLAVVVIKISIVAAICVISISCSKCSTNERFSGNMIKNLFETTTHDTFYPYLKARV